MVAFPTTDVDQGVGPNKKTINTIPNSGQTTLDSGLPVSVASDQFLDDNIVRTPALNVAAYSDGMVVGGQQTFAMLRNAAANASGVLNTIWVASKSGKTAGLSVYVFKAPPASSTVADHGGFILNAADVDKLVMPPRLLFPVVLGSAYTGTFGEWNGSVSVRNKEGTPTVNLYLVAVVAGAVTFPASDLVFGMNISQN